MSFISPLFDKRIRQDFEKIFVSMKAKRGRWSRWYAHSKKKGKNVRKLKREKRTQTDYEKQSKFIVSTKIRPNSCHKVAFKKILIKSTKKKMNAIFTDN